MAMITFCTLPRVSAISAIASRIDGIDINPSITRITTESISRIYPAQTPISIPTTEDAAATANPTISETRAPYSTRE